MAATTVTRDRCTFTPACSFLCIHTYADQRPMRKARKRKPEKNKKSQRTLTIPSAMVREQVRVPLEADEHIYKSKERQALLRSTSMGSNEEVSCGGRSWGRLSRASAAVTRSASAAHTRTRPMRKQLWAHISARRSLRLGTSLTKRRGLLYERIRSCHILCTTGDVTRTFPRSRRDIRGS